MIRFVGFDTHKSYGYVVELREGGDRLDYRVGLPGGLEAFKLRLGPDVHLVMEASTSTFRLADELEPHVGRLVVADAAQTRGAISKAATTDRNAAEALARLLASDFVRPVWVPPPDIRYLRNLVELRVKLARTRTAAANRLRALLRQELVASGPGRPKLVEATVKEQLREDASLQAYCSSLFRLQQQIAEECACLDETLKAWSRRSQDARLLMSVPGVGPLVAVCLVAQIGDIKRFASPGKLCSYAGLVPRVHESGQSRRSGGITRMGRRSLRWAMSMAAMSASNLDGPFKAFKSQLCERRPRGVAMVACARKMLAAVWRVWTSGVPYQDQDEQRHARKLAQLDRVRKSQIVSTDSGLTT